MAAVTHASTGPEVTETWKDASITAARRLAATTAAGVVLGVLVGGVGGRLPLALLPLVALLPFAPLPAALALGWLVLEALRRRHGGVVPGATAAAWVGRAALCSPLRGGAGETGGGVSSPRPVTARCVAGTSRGS